MRLWSIALVLLGLSAAPASAYQPGDNISGQPEIVQALNDASGYWHGAKAPCPAGITVRVVEHLPGTVVAEATDCAISIGIDFYSPLPDRGRYCALFAHEYGHLLGHEHEAYPDDAEGIMANPAMPRYCFNLAHPPQPKTQMPAACRWPAWARVTTNIRRLYAAGKATAARAEFLRWRKQHPRQRVLPCAS